MNKKNQDNFTKNDVLFTFNEEDDFEVILSEFLEVIENKPDDFDTDNLYVPIEESEWADQTGNLEVSPKKFIVEVLSGKAPDEVSCAIDFIGWQEAYTDVGEIMHGLSYHGPAVVTISLKRAWRNTENILLAEYEVIGIEEG